MESQVTAGLLLQEEQVTFRIGILPTLATIQGLLTELDRQEEVILDHRVPGRQLVHRCGPVPEPLAGHEDRGPNMKLKFDHLKRRRVLVPHEITDEGPVVRYGLGAGSVRDSGCLDDRRVGTHVVDQTGLHFTLELVLAF